MNLADFVQIFSLIQFYDSYCHSTSVPLLTMQGLMIYYTFLFNKLTYLTFKDFTFISLKFFCYFLCVSTGIVVVAKPKSNTEIVYKKI